jgi:hypothetical protein
MKIETKILCYSGRQSCDTKRVKQIDYTVIDMGNGNSKREINKRYLK